ncbi:MAG: insulinase family protein [Magnetococcus sp. MYC-9]
MRVRLLQLFVWGIVLFSALVAHANPGAQLFQGPGGMPVYLLESSVNPMVEIRIYARGGSVYDPAGKSGVASLTAWMFNEGGGEWDAATFQERLEFHGILMDATAGLESMVVKLTTLSEHLEEAWARLADALLRPRLEAKDFARAVAEQKALILKERQQPQTQAALVLQRLLYGNHPYGAPVQGTLESLSRIRLEDIRRFHADTFHGPEMVLVVAGDVGRSRLQGLLDRHLADLRGEPGPRAAVPPVEGVSAKAAKTRHLEMDLPQTTLLLGAIGIHRRDPDYYAVYVLNQILGGAGLTSRLSMEIRERRGLTYGVYSRFSPLSREGPFVVAMKTKTESTGEALALLRQELQRVAREGVAELELQEVVHYLTGSFPLHLDGLGKLAVTWGTIGFYQLGDDYLERWPERIRAVTREDIQRVAQRLLDLDRFCTVTVGK